MEIIIVNVYEAIIFIGNRQIRLSHSGGDVRSLVRYMLVPFNVNEDLREPAAYQKAMSGMSEDTTEINIDVA